MAPRPGIKDAVTGDEEREGGEGTGSLAHPGRACESRRAACSSEEAAAVFVACPCPCSLMVSSVMVPTRGLAVLLDCGGDRAPPRSGASWMECPVRCAAGTLTACAFGCSRRGIVDVSLSELNLCFLLSGKSGCVLSLCFACASRSPALGGRPRSVGAPISVDEMGAS